MYLCVFGEYMYIHVHAMKMWKQVIFLSKLGQVDDAVVVVGTIIFIVEVNYGCP